MSQKEIHFTKCHGYGNDFLVIAEDELDTIDLTAAEAALQLCPRHTGVGADGIVVWRRPTTAEPIVTRIINADGSEAESSGNGFRCLVASLLVTGEVTGPMVSLATLTGERTVETLERDGGRFVFRSDLGPVELEPARIPFAGGTDLPPPILNYPITVGDRTFACTILATGNPHCIVPLPGLDAGTIEATGPVIESLSLFPARTNVEFVEVLDRSTLHIAIWERGVGPTQSSGTGSAAAAAAAILNRWTDSSVTVRMPGGDVRVSWTPPGSIIQEAVTEFICSGTALITAETETDHRS